MKIVLSGPQGNAFYLLGLVPQLANKLDKDADAITKEMTSVDYENLVKVFIREFNSLVTVSE